MAPKAHRRIPHAARRVRRQWFRDFPNLRWGTADWRREWRESGLVAATTRFIISNELAARGVEVF